mgnify:CR=1 FL=1
MRSERGGYKPDYVTLKVGALAGIIDGVHAGLLGRVTQVAFDKSKFYLILNGFLLKNGIWQESYVYNFYV